MGVEYISVALWYRTPMFELDSKFSAEGVCIDKTNDNNWYDIFHIIIHNFIYFVISDPDAAVYHWLWAFYLKPYAARVSCQITFGTV